MTIPATHLRVIGFWPTIAEFGRAIGVKPNNARNMAKSGIPSKYWNATVKAVTDAGFPPVSYAELRGIDAVQPEKDT